MLLFSYEWLSTTKFKQDNKNSVYLVYTLLVLMSIQRYGRVLSEYLFACLLLLLFCTFDANSNHETAALLFLSFPTGVFEFSF